MAYSDGFFTVLEIHRKDLIEVGFDASEVDDRSMTLLASYLGEYFVESGLFWKALRMYARKMGLSASRKTRMEMGERSEEETWRKQI